jgi:hypothetical protein
LELTKSGYGSLTTTTSLDSGDRVSLGDLPLLKQQVGATTGVVRGAVTDFSTGQPVSGVLIQASSGGSATTAADGTYQIADVPAGAPQTRRANQVARHISEPGRKKQCRRYVDTAGRRI